MNIFPELEIYVEPNLPLGGSSRKKKEDGKKRKKKLVGLQCVYYVSMS